jgi:hypothetical protein
VPASNASRSNYQAALPQHTSSLLKTLRHRHGNDPSIGFEDNDHLPVGNISNFTFGSQVMPLLDAAFKLLKPTLRE